MFVRMHTLREVECQKWPGGVDGASRAGSYRFTKRGQ